MSTQFVLPEYLRGSLAGRVPPLQGDAPQKVAWLRGHLRLYVRELAVLVFVGMLDAAEAETESLLSAGGTVRDLKWPHTIAKAAHDAEWRDAAAYVSAGADRIVREVRPCILRREPGERVFAAAVAADTAIIFPSPVLIEICARVANAGGRYRGRP